MPCYVKTFVTGDTTDKGFRNVLSILKKKTKVAIGPEIGKITLSFPEPRKKQCFPQPTRV